MPLDLGISLVFYHQNLCLQKDTTDHIHQAFRDESMLTDHFGQDSTWSPEKIIIIQRETFIDQLRFKG